MIGPLVILILILVAVYKIIYGLLTRPPLEWITVIIRLILGIIIVLVILSLMLGVLSGN